MVLLNNQKLNESKKLKTIHKKELEVGFGDDSYELNEESEEEPNYDEDELINKCVSKLLKNKKFLTNDFNFSEDLNMEVQLFLKKI